MSVLHMIACGMIEIDDSNFKLMRREVRLELRQKQLRMTNDTYGFKILKRQKKNMGRPKYKAIAVGKTFQSVCARAVKAITPSDHEGT